MLVNRALAASGGSLLGRDHVLVPHESRLLPDLALNELDQLAFAQRLGHEVALKEIESHGDHVVIELFCLNTLRGKRTVQSRLRASLPEGIPG
jgi:hypothetical protein